MATLVDGTNQIKTAVLLAAGTGSRLQPLTDESPKCLTEVNEVTILERLIRGLRAWNFRRLVIVVGHLDRCVREFLDRSSGGLTIEYVYCPEYRTTNNIYSLWAARRAVQESFLLLECDLVFDSRLLGGMLAPDRIAVSETLPWMNGTTVTLDNARQVSRFHLGGTQPLVGVFHKTVNMYSFSWPTWQRVASELERYISSGRVNEYYESVFAEMVAGDSLSFEAVFFDNQRWYEIDTLEDLHQAEHLFAGIDGRRESEAVRQ
jgi:choline kinase